MKLTVQYTSTKKKDLKKQNEFPEGTMFCVNVTPVDPYDSECLKKLIGCDFLILETKWKPEMYPVYIEWYDWNFEKLIDAFGLHESAYTRHGVVVYEILNKNKKTKKMFMWKNMKIYITDETWNDKIVKKKIAFESKSSNEEIKLFEKKEDIYYNSDNKIVCKLSKEKLKQIVNTIKDNTFLEIISYSDWIQ